MSQESSTESEHPSKVERHGNVITISRPEGTYSIIYDTHIGRKKQEIPSGVDGVCFEWTGKYPSTREELREVAYVLANQKPVFDHAFLRRLPLLAVDCSISSIAFAEEMLGPIEFVMGASLFNKIREQVRTTGITRRNFIKTMLARGAALYLSLPTISELGRAGSSLSGIGERQTTELSKLTQRIHPEYKVIILGLRDAVAVQKMQYLLRNQGYKHLLAPRGAAHVGMEDAILASEEERIDFLTRLKPLLPKVLADQETFFQIYEYRLSSSLRWEVARKLEEPRLREIMRPG